MGYKLSQSVNVATTSLLADVNVSDYNYCQFTISGLSGETLTVSGKYPSGNAAAIKSSVGDGTYVVDTFLLASMSFDKSAAVNTVTLDVTFGVK